MTSLEAYQHRLESAADSARIAVYEAIVDEYPLLFGYWIQYAEFVGAQGDLEAQTAVYQRAVAAIPSSVTLWVSYLTFLIDKKKANVSIVSRAFQNAETQAGRDFYSHPIWDKHLEYADSVDPSGNASAEVLKMATQYPLHQYSRYFEQMSKLSAKIPELAPEVQRFTHIQKAVNDRWAFESKITQSYFHVVALDAAQVANWTEYLDYEEASDLGPEQVRSVYERCLVPCAWIPSLWLRYFSWASTPEEKADIARRGVKFTGSLDLRLLWAVLEESAGKPDVARDILDNALSVTTDSQDIQQIYTYRYHLERRSGHGDEYLKQINNEYTYGLAAQHNADPSEILGKGLKTYPHSIYLHTLKIKLGLATWKDILSSPLPPDVIAQLGPEAVDKTIGTREWLQADYEFYGPFSVQSVVKSKLADDGKPQTTDRRLLLESGHPGVQVEHYYGSVYEEDPFEKYIKEQKEMRA